MTDGTLAELRARRHDVQRRSDVVSYVRRLAQGRLDLVRAEQRRRAIEGGSLFDTSPFPQDRDDAATSVDLDPIHRDDLLDPPPPAPDELVPFEPDDDDELVDLSDELVAMSDRGDAGDVDGSNDHSGATHAVADTGATHTDDEAVASVHSDADISSELRVVLADRLIAADSGHPPRPAEDYSDDPLADDLDERCARAGFGRYHELNDSDLADLVRALEEFEVEVSAERHELFDQLDDLTEQLVQAYRLSYEREGDTDPGGGGDDAPRGRP